ncbi:MAG: hypothetical protein JWN20_1700 [Jatrophihabitantaceae bacterium]|nr:hypothetical protein [Jatrophihabitantaceae bacterium]
MRRCGVAATGIAIRRARVDGYRELQDIVLGADGSRTLADSVGPPMLGPDDVDAAGRVVLPGLVDAHVHLDKAYAMDALAAAGAFDQSGIAGAIAATQRLRAGSDVRAILPGMSRVLEGMQRTGTVAARAHVEIDVDVDPATVRLHREACALHPGVSLQLVAFPQNGTSGRGDMARRLEQALDDGCEVVGACPYADADPEAHLDLVVALARERGLPLDLHLDLTDDPDASQLDLVIPRIEKAGLQGRVTVGHMTALSAMSPPALAAAIAALQAAGVSVVSIPTTDLWLSGRSAQPRTRGVAPIRDLLDGGVRVALASNNYQNAFTPVGAGGLLRVAWLASLVAHMGDPAGQGKLLAAVTSTPAWILGLGPWSVETATVPLLVIDAFEVLDSVREAPPIVARVVAPPQSEPGTT